MRFTKPLLTSLVLSSLALAVGIAPAQSQSVKGEPARSRSAQAADQTAAAKTQAGAGLSLAAETALAGVQSRLADKVRTQGTSSSFATFADPATGKIVIETDAPDDEVARLVGSAAATVEVRRAAVTDAFSRKADTSPFWGGSGIRAAGAGTCSSGFAVKNWVGTRFLTTAGHCFANGATAVTESGGLAVGTVSNRGLPSYDMELIGGKSYGASIFVGGVNSSTGNPVVAAADPVVNFTGYCHSGRTTGENCAHKVISVNAQVCTSSGCKSPVIAFTGGVIPQPGDSGSPFYIKSGSNVHIRGMIIAIGGGTAYAEKWSRISARLGVSIVT